jgi:ATP-binding cassette, subfamily G (WHITE), member 2, SNQ2
LAAPAAGVAKVTFASRHAAGLGTQCAVLLARQWAMYGRNVPLNWGRWFALTFLALLFGTIWYNIYLTATDVGGVQSLVGGIFMTAAFGSMVSMNTIVPNIIQARAVFYREQASAMYDPLAYSLAQILTELPWSAGLLLENQVIVYFMFGLTRTPAAFFFHYLTALTLGTVYVSLGTFVAATVPTFEVAQAILGLIGPLFFLFGGLWSPPPAMAPGARWFCYIDPITYAFKALIPQQFYCAADGYGAACGSLAQISPAGLTVVDRYAYVSNKYDISFSDMWNSLGYLAIFIIVFQALAFRSTRYVKHIVR